MQLQPSLSTSDPTNCIQTGKKSSPVQGVSVVVWPALPSVLSLDSKSLEKES